MVKITDQAMAEYVEDYICDLQMNGETVTEEDYADAVEQYEEDKLRGLL